MRIKMFPLKTEDADSDGAVMLPDGWHPISAEGSDSGRVYVWAYELPAENEKADDEMRGEIREVNDAFNAVEEQRRILRDRLGKELT